MTRQQLIAALIGIQPLPSIQLDGVTYFRDAKCWVLIQGAPRGHRRYEIPLTSSMGVRLTEAFEAMVKSVKELSEDADTYFQLCESLGCVPPVLCEICGLAHVQTPDGHVNQYDRGPAAADVARTLSES